MYNALEGSNGCLSWSQDLPSTKRFSLSEWLLECSLSLNLFFCFFVSLRLSVKVGLTPSGTQSLETLFPTWLATLFQTPKKWHHLRPYSRHRLRPNSRGGVGEKGQWNSLKRGGVGGEGEHGTWSIEEIGDRYQVIVQKWNSVPMVSVITHAIYCPYHRLCLNMQLSTA